MAKTKCPAVYRNLGLETFGNKKKVTEEILKQFCKNDEYLYQQIRILLDLSDPESRKRFHPPNFEDEIKSFGYTDAVNSDNNKPCYQFDNGGEYIFGVDFNTKNDDVFVKEGITYYNDESIIDFDKSDGVSVFVSSNEESGYVRALDDGEEDVTEKVEHSHWEYTKAEKTVTQTTVKDGKVVKDSYCYGPYGSMKPNGWWYVGFDKNKNYNVKSKWKKKPYTEGIPTKCRAQTFTAQHTGYITKVNINVITESNKKTASPFSCEIWKTKKGVPYGGPIARVEKSFTDSNAYTGAHIKTFKFNKKAVVTKGHKYAIVMRSPLSHEGACYRIAGWPRTCYTNYMKGTYYYGSAYQSLDNGKTWLKYDKNAYGKLNYSKSTMPVAFGFEVYVQPTRNVPKTKDKPATKKLVQDPPTYNVIGTKTLYTVGDHYIYFNIPVTNPINQLTIDEGIYEGLEVEGNEIHWDISYNGEDFSNKDLMSNSMGNGAGNYDLSASRPTFVTVRCNLKNTNKYNTPTLRSVQFIVHTDPARKAYVRSLPYCPESETMLPACIWSEVNAEYENEENTSVKVDVVKEVNATQTFSIRRDTIDELGNYYKEFYPNDTFDFETDDSFREAIQDDEDFLNYLRNDLEPSIYVISSYPETHEKYYKYFDSLELRNYPAYPMVSCRKSLGERILEVEDFSSANYSPDNKTYTFDMGRDLSDDLVNIEFREPQNTEEKQEGVVENVLEKSSNYSYTNEGAVVFNDNGDYTFSEDKKSIVFNMQGTNLLKNIALKSNGEIKCFKTHDNQYDIAEADTNYVGESYQSTKVNADYSVSGLNITTGDVIELVINLQDMAFNEHIHYTVDYENKLVTPRPSMFKNLSSCELVFTYNPLWVRDLTSDNFPLKMDLWTETFEVGKDTELENGLITFTTKVAPRDNLREVVLYDDEDTLTRTELIEDLDFVVDYQKNKIIFNNSIEDGTPITVRYTPNLTETGLSLCYRLDREDDESQAYVYSNYFTTRT